MRLGLAVQRTEDAEPGAGVVVSSGRGNSSWGYRAGGVVMSVQGCGERETKRISQTHLGSDWDIY